MYGASMGTLSAIFFQQTFSTGTVQEVIWESESNISPNATLWKNINIDLFKIDTRNNYYVSVFGISCFDLDEFYCKFDRLCS